MQSIITKLSERHQRAAANKSAVDREAAALKQYDKVTAELTPFDNKIAKLREMIAGETPRYSNPNREVNDLAKPFVEGVEFPPKNLDVKAAATAFVWLTFSEQRRQWLKERVRSVEAEAAPLRQKLVEIQEQLNRVQSELASA